ncbi:MAG: ribbon-helix-helix domain-containing protein [Rhodospirillaceae bacterium]
MPQNLPNGSESQAKTPDQAVGPVAESSPSKNHSPGGKKGDHGLKSYNVVIDGKRTSIRLDDESHKSLLEIAKHEHLELNDLCTEINKRNKSDILTFTAAVQKFMLGYYREAATEEGHRLAGHCTGLGTRPPAAK